MKRRDNSLKLLRSEIVLQIKPQPQELSKKICSPKKNKF